MLDALLYSVRDAIKAAGFRYGQAECDLMPDGRPPPRCGNFFAAIHGGKATSDKDNQLDERYSFLVTLTMRVKAPWDRTMTAEIARNVALASAQQNGFDAKVEQLRGFLHMNWQITVLTGQTPNSANDNLAAWATGTVYGFCEPMRYRGASVIEPKGDEWFGQEPSGTDDANLYCGVASELRFEGARRFQGQTAASGPFV